MHEHELFLKEKEEIDMLLQNHCKIVRVKENLSGAFVSFQLADQADEERITTLHLLTPDARKHLTNQLSTKKMEKSRTSRSI